MGDANSAVSCYPDLTKLAQLYPLISLCFVLFLPKRKDQEIKLKWKMSMRSASMELACHRPIGVKPKETSNQHPINETALQGCQSAQYSWHFRRVTIKDSIRSYRKRITYGCFQSTQQAPRRPPCDWLYSKTRHEDRELRLKWEFAWNR